MKTTQKQRILAYLRKHKRATNMELLAACWCMCPWRRIGEMEEEFLWSAAVGCAGQVSASERIVRRTIKTTGGARVTEYRLERI